jgi:hypothetical protein
MKIRGVRWTDGRVWTEDSVAAPKSLNGESMRDGFFDGIGVIARGLVQVQGRSLLIGRFELLRFGTPEVGEHEVEWPVTGGLLAAWPGSAWSIRSVDGRLVASLAGYQPSLPRALYIVTQLQVHHALTRLLLLRMRGRRPVAGVTAGPAMRLAAGAIDAGVCAGLALLLGRRHRIAKLAGVTAGYHIACWVTSGRTLGGMVMHQRVVAVDGSRPTPAQAALRLAALPVALARLRAVHDEVAATDVIAD